MGLHALYQIANALTGNLARFVPAGTLPPGFNPHAAQSSPAALQHLPAAVRSGYIHTYPVSLQPVFLIAGERPGLPRHGVSVLWRR